MHNRQVPIPNLSAFFSRNVWLLIIVPERMLSESHEIPTSQTWTVSRDAAITPSYSKNSFSVFQPEKNWINAAISQNSKFRY